MVEVDENTCSTQSIFRWILTLFYFLIFMTAFLFNTGGNFIKKSCRGEALTTIKTLFGLLLILLLMLLLLLWLLLLLGTYFKLTLSIKVTFTWHDSLLRRDTLSY